MSPSAQRRARPHTWAAVTIPPLHQDGPLVLQAQLALGRSSTARRLLLGYAEGTRLEADTANPEAIMLPIRRILHPTDFSERSQAAFQTACALARDYSAPLVVLHVSTPLVAYGDGMFSVPPANFTEELRAKLQKVRPNDPRVLVEHRLIEGDPPTEILRTARESGCDLIVMGTHGWTGLSRLLMGSIAEQVVRRAPCPVLTVKTPLTEAEPVTRLEAVASK
jgi:nucleotide-binding universal stress UspA family protein